MKEKVKTAAYVFAIVYIALSLYGKGINRGKVACIENPSDCIKGYAIQKGIPYGQREPRTHGP